MKAGGLKVGCNFSLQETAIIDASHYWHIEIGDNVTLAGNVSILAHEPA
jgi:maltose O-acetyltransferase